MRRILLIIILGTILIVPGLLRAENPFEFYTPKFELTQRLTEGYNATPEVTTTTQKKLPGRAMLLSMVLPGMGQFYAGSKIRGAVFLALEVAGWTTFAVYQTQGKDKENEYEDFADQHWHRSPYWDAVQEIAVTNGWTGGNVENASWSELINYLPANFTHELPSTNNQQYYEMIGKYLSQFGFGWDDQEGDVDSTQYFDGHFSQSRPFRYEDIRFESNQALDHATAALEVVLVNHVISALDAGFLVRRHNKRAVETSLNFEQKMFNKEPVTMANVRIQW
jgi:hypothetical protein